MKKRISIFLSLIISITTLFSLSVGCSNKQLPGEIPYEGVNYEIISEEINNLILVIGDGMGENHIENAIRYFDIKRPEFIQKRCGSVITYSYDNWITDSAAGATAYATGKKVYNGNLGCFGDEDLVQITDLAKNFNKKVGIVTTDLLTGATPSGFSANAQKRSMTDKIISCQIESGIDLFIGKAEKDNYYYQNYHDEYENLGYGVANNETELLNLLNSEKVFATLPNLHSDYFSGNEEHFQLLQMVQFAIEFLSKENDNGFLLVIESAYIDKYSHEKQLIPALCEVRSLFDTMDYLLNTVSNDTAVLLTADHETGGLKLGNDLFESNVLYSHGSHTSIDVPLFIHNFEIVKESDKSLQNIEIFNICRSLLNI